MHLVDEFLPRITSFSSDVVKVAALHAETLSNHVLKLSAEVADAGKNTVNALARVIRTTEGLDSLVRFGVDGITFIDSILKVETVARPLVVTCNHLASFISVGRILYSINYIASGKFFEDIAEQKVLPVIGQAAFLVRRLIVGGDWFLNHDIDLVSPVANQTANIPLFSTLSSIPKNQFLRGALVTALIPLAVMFAENIMEGKEVRYSAFELANISLDIGLTAWALVSDVALTAFGIPLAVSPLVLQGLSVISAGAGVLAAFHNPANRVQN